MTNPVSGNEPPLTDPASAEEPGSTIPQISTPADAGPTSRVIIPSGAPTSVYGNVRVIVVKGYNADIAQNIAAAQSILEVAKLFQGPTVIFYDFGQPTTSLDIIGTHANEQSSYHALWNFHKDLPVNPTDNKVFLVTNPVAAVTKEFGERFLTNQEDPNRIFDQANHPLVQPIMAILKAIHSQAPFHSAVDWHNTSSVHGPYVLYYKDPTLGKNLVGPDGNVVFFPPEGSIIAALERDLGIPAALLEGGKMDDPRVHALVSACLRWRHSVLSGALLATRSDVNDLRIVSTAYLEDKKTVPLAHFTGPNQRLIPGTLALGDIERYNLGMIPAGAVIGKWFRPEGYAHELPLKVLDKRPGFVDRRMTGEVLHHNPSTGLIHVKRPIASVMGTENHGNMRKSDVFSETAVAHAAMGARGQMTGMRLAQQRVALRIGR
jgi:hypothetical protein